MSSRQKTIVILAAALIVLLAISQRPTLQLTAALATCLLLPGLGWARKLRVGDRGDTLAMTLVISICATVAVSTAMAVASQWSVITGFAALAGITLAGFVPYRQLALRAGAVLPAPVAVNGERVAWIEWYDDARRQAAAEREAAERRAAESAEEWRAWYAQRPTTEEPAVWDLDAERRRVEIPKIVEATPPEPVPAVVAIAEAPTEEDEDLSGVGSDWTDWYAVARNRDDSARRKAESADRRSGEAWRDWYRRASKDAPIHHDR